MKIKKLKGYRLVFDAFGDMPIWSLQHPEKETEDSYMIIDLNDDQTGDILYALEEVDRLWFGVYITGEIKYVYDKKLKDNILLDLKIDKIELFNEKEEGQP